MDYISKTYRQSPRGTQFKIHGNVVNVPADIIDTVSVRSLPQPLSQAATIKINQKRTLQYKSSVLSLNIRPHKVIQAAVWLVKNSKLYVEEGVTINESWATDYKKEILENQNSNCEDCNVLEVDIKNKEENLESAGRDEWNEKEGEIPAGVTDTVLTPTDFLDDSARNTILNMAPAEGNRPLSVFQDKYSEELAYPNIFLGQKDLISEWWMSTIATFASQN